MRRISAVILFLFVAMTSVSAQKKLNVKPKEVEWADKPMLHPVPPEYASEPAIVLQHDVSYDYKEEGRHLVAYVTYHRIIKVLDEKGIETFNTEGIYVDGRTRVPAIKARTILPDGKVMDIAKDMIKVNRMPSGHYRIAIAMEGVEKNSEIEVLVKEIRPGYNFGSEIFQMPFPIVSSRFRLTYPKDLLFEEKGYNGFPTVRDTLLNNRRHIEVALANVPAMEKEPYSFYDVNCMRMEYHLYNYINENNYDTLRKLNTWDELARAIYNDVYKISDTERKAVNAYLTELGVHPGGNEMENIRKIEDGIKKNIVLYPYVDNERADMLDTVIAKKAATSTGYIKLFAACLSQALVSHELGMAGDRTERWFDSKFENWDNLDYHVFYFPKQKKFLSPTSTYYRCPVIPPYLTSQKGIFCAIPPKGPLRGPMVHVRNIAPLTPEQNEKNIAAAITFNKNMDATMDISYACTGYLSTALRTSLLLETKDKEREVVEKMLKVADKPTDIMKYTISNEGIDNYYTNTPVELTATINASHLVEKAGRQYLLKLGEITSDDIELYQKKERITPVDLMYPQSNVHTITVHIPKGYTVMNLDAIRMESEYVDKKLQSLVSFKSDYKLIPDKKNGDKLIVTVTEKYPHVHFSKTDYERFRAVINTAADFNKVTLLLARKGQI